MLHLDCAFMPVANNCALIYRDGFSEFNPLISELYELIEVNKQEQQGLATNVLSLSPNTVVSRKKSVRVNALLRSRGVEVIELALNDTVKTGGAFRCATLPLIRRND